MSESRIEIMRPTSRAMGRMTSILFRPFDFGKWFVLGFTAWLAFLTEGGSSSSGGGGGDEEGLSSEEDLREVLNEGQTYVRENLDWILPLGIGLVVFLVVLYLVALWVGSRGKFLFLDNVVHNRALVRQPWGEFREQGNSLFLWRLVFHFLFGIVVLSLVGVAGYGAFLCYQAELLLPGWLAGFIGLGIGLLLLILVASYFLALLEDFVIPVMYRQALTTNAAWRSVLSLHGQQSGSFFLYILWRLVLKLAEGMIIIAFIIVTCCMGALLLIIPVIGAMVTLPITVFFRSFGPEFLRQFGPEVDLWADGQDPFGFEALPPPESGGF